VGTPVSDAIPGGNDESGGGYDCVPVGIPALQERPGALTASHRPRGQEDVQRDLRDPLLKLRPVRGVEITQA
jgi:hypothetical protein